MNTDRADVSVIIPTYNRPELLAEAIDSVLGQTVQPREIIVVDNGTDDRTQQMIHSYLGCVTYYREPPIGKHAARRLGVERSSSAWIAILDDDDLYQPRYIEYVRDIIADGRADIIFSNHRCFNAEHLWKHDRFEYAPEGYWNGITEPELGSAWSFVGSFPVEKMLVFNALEPGTMVISRTLLERAGGFDVDVPHPVGETFELHSRILTKGQLALVWEPMLLYRRHEGNCTADPQDAFFGKWLTLEYIHERNTHGNSRLERALKDDLPSRRSEVFDMAFRKGDFSMARTAAISLQSHDWTVRRRVYLKISQSPLILAKIFRLAVRAIEKASRHRHPDGKFELASKKLPVR